MKTYCIEINSKKYNVKGNKLDIDSDNNLIVIYKNEKIVFIVPCMVIDFIAINEDEQ
jgi:hypothetical protein